MLAKKLTALISHFTQKEWKAFHRHLASPAHNTDESIRRLAHYIHSLAPAFAPEHLSAETLWRTLYSEGALKPGVLRVKLSQLSRHAEDYLIARELASDEQLRGELLLRARRATTDFSTYKREVDKQVRRMKNELAKGPDFYERCFRLRAILRKHPGYNDRRDGRTNLIGADEDLDAWFILHKLRLHNQLRNRRDLLGEEFQQRFVEEVVGERHSGLLKNDPLAGLYGGLFSVLDTAAEGKPSSFRTRFTRDHAALPEEDVSNIFYTTLNFFTRRVNEGETKFYDELLSWYRTGLDTGVLLTDGYISSTTFSNIVLLGYRAGKVDWTDAFLKDYSGYLKDEEKAEVLIVSQATGAFYTGAFEEAAGLLEARITAPRLQLRGRLTEIRALFELMVLGEREYEDLDRAATNFESWLQRQKAFSRAAVLPYLNHLRILRRLSREKLQGRLRIETCKKLTERVEQQEFLVAKTWLLDKIKKEERT